MRCFRTVQSAALLTLLGGPTVVFAQIPNVPSTMNGCGFLGGLPCVSNGVAGLRGFIEGVIIPGLMGVFLAAAVLFFFAYAIRLIAESEDENTITETKSAYAHAIGGAAMVALAGLLAQAFGEDARATLIEPGPIWTGLDNVVLFIRLMVSVSATAMIVFQGMRLILLQGQESEIEQQKKRFFHGLLGVAIVLLANIVISAVFPGGGAPALANEIAGIINFLLTIFGAVCVLAVIVGGIFLVVSTNDSLKDRAKKSVFTAVIALIVVLCSFMIVNFVAFI